MCIKKYQYLVLFLFVFVFFSCNNSNDDNKDKAIPLHTHTITYAQGFSIDYFEEYTRLTVNNPWEKGAILQRFYLVENSKTKTPKDGTKVLVPIESIIVNSSTHVAFTSIIDEVNSIVGVCSPERIFNPIILEGVKKGKIAHIGDAFAMNTEKIMLLKPDAIMVSGYNQQDSNIERMMKLGIPVIINNEWMESSGLGRAEWIKFVAAFYNKTLMGDSIFNAIAESYNELNELASEVTNKPTIASGSSFKGTWYLPAGKSFMSRFYQDAGGDYLFANDTTSGSLPLSFEVALKELRTCDVWLGVNVGSLSELKSMDSRLSLFEAFKNKRVYSFNKRMTKTGGNDYWETAVVRPDLLLRDIILSLHPYLLPNDEFYFIHQLD